MPESGTHQLENCYIRVPSWDKRDNGVIFYNVIIELEGGSLKSTQYQSAVRYSQLSDFKQQLKALNIKTPPGFPKKLTLNLFNKSFIAERATALEIWLNILMTKEVLNHELSMELFNYKREPKAQTGSEFPKETDTKNPFSTYVDADRTADQLNSTAVKVEKSVEVNENEDVATAEHQSNKEAVFLSELHQESKNDEHIEL